MNIFIIIKKSQHPSLGRGFSIIELIVAVSIFIILTTTLLFNYNSFNRHITLDTLAHQIAQWVRDAQVSAMSVKRSDTGVATFPGYGLHFDITTPNKFIYFADLNQNKTYDLLVAPAKCGDPLVECKKEITLLRGNAIDSLCGEVSTPSFTAKCGTIFGGSNLFDIVFTRPNPDADITGDLNGASFGTAYDRARITVASPSGYKRTIEIWTTGQISVQ